MFGTNAVHDVDMEPVSFTHIYHFNRILSSNQHSRTEKFAKQWHWYFETYVVQSKQLRKTLVMHLVFRFSIELL
jgi:hypothetical protein